MLLSVLLKGEITRILAGFLGYPNLLINL